MFVLCCVCFTLKCQDFRCFYKFNVTGQYSYTFKNIVNQCSDANTVCDVCPVFSFHLFFSFMPFFVNSPQNYVTLYGKEKVHSSDLQANLESMSFCCCCCWTASAKICTFLYTIVDSGSQFIFYFDQN